MRHLSILLFVLIFAAGCSSTQNATRDQLDPTYHLNPSTNLEEGSVRVRANEVFLKEGVDYTVNRAEGTVSIINPTYLKPGIAVEIIY